MEQSLPEWIYEINRLMSETDGLYHRAARKLGLTDSAMRVLYALWETGGQCQLSRVYKESGISRQTVNSALRKLEQEGIVTLETHRGKAKLLKLTAPGQTYAAATVGKLFQAEIAVLSGWSPEQLRAHVALLESYCQGFARQVETLTPDRLEDLT